MKKIYVLFCLVFIIWVGQPGHAQLAVFDTVVESLLGNSIAAQATYYAQQLYDNAMQITNTVSQLEHMANTVKMQVNNLSRIGEINSWDDFMEWHNRQLYLERKTEETFLGMNVSIGNKNYSLWDVEGIAYGIKDTVEWKDEFTPEQQKEMWLRLGLTSSNYAYVQTWKEREKDLARKFLTSSSIQNNEYMQRMIRNSAFLRRLAGDADLDIDEKIGEKELEAMEVEVAIDTNKLLNDLVMIATDFMELKAVEMYQAQTPMDQPFYSDWPDDVFKPLAD
jgi:hypothetical protein